MTTYIVRWEIDMEADSPEEAAAKALIIQRDNDPANSATVFDVAEFGTDADWMSDEAKALWKRIDCSVLEEERQDQDERHTGVMRFYDCPCGHSWSDEWDCACDDRCPKCNTSCSPTRSEEAEKPRALDVCKLLVAYHDNLTPDSVGIADVITMARRVISEASKEAK